MTPRPPTVVIENVSPLIDAGRYPVKRGVGEDLLVEADIYKDGHDVVSAVLKWRRKGAARWHETPMAAIPNGNDRWRATCSFFENTTYQLTIEAWGDTFRSWQHEFHTKFSAGLQDLTSESLEGAALVEKAAQLAAQQGQGRDQKRLLEIAETIRTGTPADVNEISHRHELEALMSAYSDRIDACEFVLDPPSVFHLIESPLEPLPLEESPALRKGARSKKKPPVIAPTAPSAAAVPSDLNLEYVTVTVDRNRALFSQWYEFFPRSAEGRGDRGSTFRDCLPRIDDARAMGFDVIYFPPIHPVGVTARKGRNNSVTCEPGEPGVPYAIGNRHQNCPNGGGHKDVAPELGTLEDLDWLTGELKARGMELALDFAINCSPDHPYVHEHPEWFYKRPDGTIKYAENPPKKYQDVYPMNFHNPNWRALWEELTSIILFWCEHNVRIFRVDNPHTKPVAFWEYLIGKVQARFPDAIFLSEAFTRPKMMKSLAKAGYTHSYTYFTWRNSKHELIEYFTELTQTAMKDYFRANLWPNTPDILPFFLQHGGRPAFMIRAVLAATLSSIYGIYSGFELCENAALPNKEEYLDSEKYQWKERDWNAPGNIKHLITALNRIRRENRALQEYSNLRFYHSDNDHVLFFGKMSEARDNIILVVVNLDPYQAQGSFIEVPITEFGWMEGDSYQVHDLLFDERYLWSGPRNFVQLDPHTKPAHIFKVRRWVSREQDFDYFM
ncbi:MAG: alpha,4-glucan--maltose-phosphate maltosyltransferase [Chthoniobacteraceae bacterium]|nr:alpha,4-glucan--maltose-phosphate maltosyltransferase [Chthoniobacteraceae bacterium]